MAAEKHPRMGNLWIRRTKVEKKTYLVGYVYIDLPSGQRVVKTVKVRQNPTKGAERDADYIVYDYSPRGTRYGRLYRQPKKQ